MTADASPTMFPALTTDEQAHTTRVSEMLCVAIAAAGGWISFADYMQRALYTPGLGYYSAGATKFGAAGDFVTAPEISELFAPLVARTLADVVDAIGGEVLELGAGTGRFAAGALPALASVARPPQRYDILEVSADLAARQRDTLAREAGDQAARVTWLKTLPQHFRGAIFANEVLDALPTERFVIRGGRPISLGVSWKHGAPAWCESPDADERSDMIAAVLGSLIATLPDGYVGECCLGAAAWIAALAAALQQGVILLIDYGLPAPQLYHPQRMAGSLRCYFRHRAHDDPFFHPGLCDISAWVNFTAVATAAVRSGLEVAGFTTQAGFLLQNGIESLLAADMSDVRRARLAHGARQLLLPGEMGESVKVIALAKDCSAALRGFSLQDLTSQL